METQLFSWTGWDQQDTAAFTFYKPVLKIQLGEFPIGHQFDHATVDFIAGTLQLVEINEVYHDYKLGLSITEHIKSGKFETT